MGKSISKHSVAALFALTLFAISPAHAQTAAWMGGTMDTNLYLGGSVGQSRFRTACDDVPVSCDDKDMAWKLSVGYRFHRNVAVEAGYFDVGKASANGPFGGATVSVEAKMHGWELVGIAIFPVYDRVELYGKLGMARSRVSVSGTAAGGGGLVFATSATENSTDLTFGAGAQYSFTRNIAARAEWQRYDSVGGNSIGKDDIDVFSLGVLYRF